MRKQASKGTSLSYKLFLLIIFLSGFNHLVAQDFMMQGWYWDYPKTTQGALWADSIRLKANDLGHAGFTGIWLPPLARASFGNASNGYDPKDLYDYGEYGGGATGFGTRSQLDNTVSALNSAGVKTIADLVFNHRDGGKAEINPGVTNYIAGYDWNKANSGANPFPYDRMRCIIPLGGSSGNGAGDYFFKISSSSQHSKFYNYQYKVYMQTNRVGWKNLTALSESEPNGGGNCGQANNNIELGRDMNATVDASGCTIDEFHLNIGSSDFYSANDTLFISFGQRGSDYSDMRIFGIWSGPRNTDIIGDLKYQTFTNFSGLPSGQGAMNWSNFKPNNDRSTNLSGDWDGMYFFYDYDQFQTDTKTKLFDWTRWNWTNVGVRGLRMDAVKHFTPQYVGELLNNLHDNSMDPPFVVGEWYSTNTSELSGWVNSVLGYMSTGAKAAINPRIFDFALRESLRQACDTYGYDVRNVFSSSLVDASGLTGYNVVTFANNHDFRDGSGFASLIQNTPMLAYAYLLTNNKIGLPCVFYPDYYGYPNNGSTYYPTDRNGLKTKINQLMSLHKSYIYGSTTVTYLNKSGSGFSNDAGSANSYLLTYQLSGGNAGKDVVVAINFGGNRVQFHQQLNNLAVGTKLTDVMGVSPYLEAQVQSNENGISNDIWIDIPARSYAVWVQGQASTVTPLPASDLKITGVTTAGLALAWTDNSSNESGFRIERKTNSGGTWATLQTVSANTTSFTDASIVSFEHYYYRVVAVNGALSSNPSNEVDGPATNTWTGAVGTDWNTPGNWSAAIVPTAADNVVIPDVANDPVINQAAGTPATCLNLKIANGGVLTVNTGKALSISGELYNQTGGALTLNATGTLALTTDWLNDGTFTAASTSTVTFSGSVAQTIGGSAASPFGNLTLNNSSGFTLAGNISVAGTLDMLSGILATGTNTITLGSSGTILHASSSKYIDGKLAHTFGVLGSKIFPLGKSGNYRPVTFEYTGLTGSSVVTAEQFETALSGTLPANTTMLTTGRHWTVSQTGGSNLQYLITLDATGYSPSRPVVMLKQDAGTVTAYATTTPGYTNASAFANLSDFGLGEACVNPSDGGTITGAQSSCSSFDPSAITSTTLPSGYSGTVEYKWQSAVSPFASWTDIGANAVSYDPPASLTATTRFKRLARVDCKTDWSGAAESNTVEMAINPATAIDNQPAATQSQCFGSSFDPVTVTATGTGLTYQWYINTVNSNSGGVSLGAGNGAQTNSYTPQGNTAGTTYYYCVVGGTCGTVTSSVATVTLYASLGGTITGGTSPVCFNTSPGTLTATGSGGTGSYNYQWYTTLGIINGATSSVYTPGNLTTATGYYCAITSGSCGTANTGTTSITVYNDLGATISGGTSPICNNTSPGSFTATGSGGNGSYSYQWHTSSGTISGATGSTYSPGNLTATTGYFCAITSSTCGTVNTSTTTITVYPGFNSGGIATTGESTCFNGDPGMIGSSTSAGGGDGSVIYQWQSSTNAGFSSSVDISNNAATFDPPAGLTTTMWYRRQAKDGTCNLNWSNSTGTWQVTVLPVFAAGSVSGNQAICFNSAPSSLTGIAPSGGNSPYGYQWQRSSDNVNFTDIAGATTLDYQPGMLTQTRYYRQKQSSAGGCGLLTTNAVTVTVNPNYIYASATVNTVCAGSYSTIYATGGYDYMWDNALGAGSSKVVSPVTTTSYTVTGKDATGCTTGFATITVSVNPLPVVSIAASAPGATGGSSSIVLGASENLLAGGASSYLWNTGSTAATLTVSPAGTTTYTVTGTTSGCSAAVSHTVNVAILNAGSNQYICNGSSASLSATSSGIPSPTYVWMPGNLSGAAVSVSPAANTVYTVTANGIYTASVTVFVRAKPAADAGPNVAIATGGSATLSGSITSATVGPYLYAWTTTGGSIVSGSSTSTPLVNAAGTYSVMVTDGNGCTSSPDNTTVTLTTSGNTVSGNVAYAFNTVNAQMHDVTVTLKQGATPVYTTTTPSTGNGNYQFLGVANGTYTVSLSSTKPWGGVTSADIILIQNHYKPVGATPLIGIKRLAADVYLNSSAASIDAYDRDLVNSRRLTPSVIFPAGDWVFTRVGDISANPYPAGQISYANSLGSTITLVVSGSAVNQDFRALCYGDVDASNTGTKDNEDVMPNVITSLSLGLTNFPNPFSDRTTVRFMVPVKGRAVVEIHTLLGALAATIDDPDDYEGLHTLFLDRKGLPAGLYLFTVRLKTSDDTFVETGKMMIVNQ